MEEMYDEEGIRLLFASNLKRLREQQNISQLTLAGLVGLTHNFINDIENCKKWISAGTLTKLCAALRVEPFQFFIDKKQWKSNNFDIYLDSISDSFMKWVSDQKQQRYPEDTKE
jgi:transcriptional regulator with XRE-family HTH domain